MAKKRPPIDDESYREFERKMIQFEYGPTTTLFEYLIGVGIELPEPDAVPDTAIRNKLWEVIAGLAQRRSYLDLTDHLSDRELYTHLWNTTLREEVPAIDEIGFRHHIEVLQCGCDDVETGLYLKYYADDKWREGWLESDPNCVMPAHEDPPYKRDCLLPRPHEEVGPDAAEWLRANSSRCAFAGNRFSSTKEALEFVDLLHSAGALEVTVDNIMFLPNHHWWPYADTFMVKPPEDPRQRHALFELIEEYGKPDEDGGEPFADRGESLIRLWWD